MEDGSELMPHSRSPDQRRKDLVEGLEELMLTPGELVHKLQKFGDDREFTVVKRSLDRMISGETKVSPEMSVIVEMLLRQHRRLKDRHAEVSWEISEHGTHQAIIDGWYVYLSPQTKGRWILSCASGPNRSDYSPPFGHWLSSLAEAKHKALVEVEEGMNELSEIMHESRKL
jgi:hypothetical protein